MRILFSFRSGGSAEQRDMWLDADPATPFSLLAEALDKETGTTFPQAWWDEERLMELDRPIGPQVRDGAILGHHPPEHSLVGTPVSAGELLAVSGPHAGTAWPLAPGRHLVGRADDASVNLVSDRLVSRRHATLDVSPGEVLVTDEGSAHGVSIDGEAVQQGAIHDGAMLQIGNTILAWQSSATPHAVVAPDGDGGLVFNRPPRLLTPSAPKTVRFPGAPPIRSGVNFPLIATLAPAVLGGVLAVVIHNPTFLLFMLLSPVIGISNYVSQRRSGRKSHREQTKRHEADLARSEAELRAVLSEETTQRRQASPDPATLAAVARGPQSSLWERRRADEDFLRLRVGLATQPASVVIEGRARGDDPDREILPSLERVPALVDLERDGVLGIAGERRACESLATALVLQAAVLHAPDDLAITILTGPHQRERWAWAKWLPHVRDKDGRCVARIGTSDAAVARLAGELSSLIDERLSSRGIAFGGQRDRPTAHLVVVDGAYQLGAMPTVTKILRRGPEAGVVSICLDDAERLLPEECHAIASLDPEQSAHVSLHTSRGSQRLEVLADLVDPAMVELTSRKLAPLRLNRRTAAGTAIPSSVRLLTLTGMEPPTAAAVAAGWNASDRSTAAVIGECETGSMIVDLAKDGPHGLVAGTTGSGKSELLQTLIASLALANRPDLMNFVLVDYKGGSAFKDCAQLPHTVGMVTDLDGHLTERALASIAAELHRREILLSDSGAKDIEGYWRTAGPTAPVLGRLLIVIDEFASLVEELPSFVDGLVDLARRGRSLGIHLILATQRPSGVVSAAIKTNTNLRIAMRVTDAADSTDVIDSALASRIQKGVPGRGYARVGHEDLTEFQAARIGGRRPMGGGPAMRVEPIEWSWLGETLSTASGPDLADDTTDLSVLVTAIHDAALMSDIAPPRSPWLPALPELITLSGEALEPARDGSLTATVGLEDLPAEQAQQPARYDLTRDGHLLVIGDPGSGRSTFLRSLAASLAARNSTADVHIYGIDCGNGALSPLESFPQVGAVVTRREPERVDRLISKLLTETTERQQMLARRGFATIADQRSLSPADERLPYVVVLLDRWEGFNAEFETVDGGRLISSVMHLMREGNGAGVRVVVTADRSGTSPRFSSLADRIVMMRMNDRTTYSVVGLNPRNLPEQIGPGRGFYARGGTEIQVGLLVDDPSGPAQVAALEELAHQACERDAFATDDRRPDSIAVLPLHVSLAETLQAVPDGGPRHPTVLAGLGGDRLAPQLVDLTRFGPGFVITGPARSGRSNALMGICHHLTQDGNQVIAITSRPSPLSTVIGSQGVLAVLDGTKTPAAELTELLASPAAEKVVVLVDDAELLADAPISDPLAAFLRTARDRGSALVMAGTTGELGQFRGFIPEVRKSKAALLLCPSSPADGDVVGARLPRTALFAGPPGRGVLITGPDMVFVQVPFDDLS